MVVLQFAITNLQVSVAQPVSGKISIKPSLSLEQSRVVVGVGNQKVLEVGFTAGYEYLPGLAHMRMQGNLTYLLDSESMQKVEEEIAQHNKIPQFVAEKVLTSIFTKTQMLAIFLSREVGLPSPIPLPKLTVESKPKES